MKLTKAWSTIGELFNMNVLNPMTVISCINELLESPDGQELPDEESLECVCALISAIGRKLDHEENAESVVRQLFASSLNHLLLLVDQRVESPRVNSIIKAVLLMRSNGWYPI